jgi:hypothetical protein
MNAKPRPFFGAAVLIAALASAVGCTNAPAPELEFADWVLPVPEGTPIVEYARVPEQERDPDAVRLVEDLVIGGDPADPNTLPGTSASDFDWPQYGDVVGLLRTDGEGRLYVFPTVEYEGDEFPDLRPVDVYSPNGDLLAAGLVSSSWTFARGPYVYGYRGDAALDQTVIIRWRLELNPR